MKRKYQRSVILSYLRKVKDNIKLHKTAQIKKPSCKYIFKILIVMLASTGVKSFIVKKKFVVWGTICKWTMESQSLESQIHLLKEKSTTMKENL